MNGATANLYGNSSKGKSAHFEPTAQMFNAYQDVQYDYRARDFVAATVDVGSDGAVVPPTSFKVFKYEGSRRHRLWCPILRENMFTEVLPVRLIGYSTVFPTFI